MGLIGDARQVAQVVEVCSDFLRRFDLWFLGRILSEMHKMYIYIHTYIYIYKCECISIDLKTI